MTAQPVPPRTIPRELALAIGLVLVSVIALASFSGFMSLALNPRVVTQQQLVTQTQFATRTETSVSYATQVSYTTMTQISYTGNGYGYGNNYPYYGYGQQYPQYPQYPYGNQYPYQGSVTSVWGYISSSQPGYGSGCVYMQGYQNGGIVTFALYRATYSGSFTSGFHSVTGYTSSSSGYSGCTGQAFYVTDFH